MPAPPFPSAPAPSCTGIGLAHTYADNPVCTWNSVHTPIDLEEHRSWGQLQGKAIQTLVADLGTGNSEALNTWTVMWQGGGVTISLSLRARYSQRRARARPCKAWAPGQGPFSQSVGNAAAGSTQV